MKRSLLILVGLLGVSSVLILAAPDPPQSQSDVTDDRSSVSPAAETQSSPQTGAETARPEQTLESSGDVRVVVPLWAEGEAARNLPLRRAPPPTREHVSAVGEKPQIVAGRLVRNPIAIDSGRLAVRSARIELSGVEPLKVTAKCEAGADIWPCGAEARNALRIFLRRRIVRCEVPGNFGQQRQTVTSTCVTGKQDIGEWIVRNGWAKATEGGPYGDAERQAKAERTGIWR